YNAVVDLESCDGLLKLPLSLLLGTNQQNVEHTHYQNDWQHGTYGAKTTLKEAQKSFHWFSFEGREGDPYDRNSTSKSEQTEAASSRTTIHHSHPAAR